MDPIPITSRGFRRGVASGEVALDTILYGRMPHDDGEDLAEALASDALALLKRRPNLKIVTLGDGAGDVQGLLEKHVDEETFKRPIHRLVATHQAYYITNYRNSSRLS